MPPLVVHVSVDSFAVGCAACGYAITVRPSEVQLLHGLVDGSHVGPLVSATHLSIDGAGFVWSGCPDLVRSVAGG